MAAAGRHPHPPRDDVPDDRAHQRAEDDVRIDDAGVDDARADRLRHVQPEHRERDEIEECRPYDRRAGLRTRVETTVAIEFAASCRPFMKSNASATATSPIKDERAERERSMRAV